VLQWLQRLSSAPWARHRWGASLCAAYSPVSSHTRHRRRRSPLPPRAGRLLPCPPPPLPLCPPRRTSRPRPRRLCLPHPLRPPLRPLPPRCAFRATRTLWVTVTCPAPQCPRPSASSWRPFLKPEVLTSFGPLGPSLCAVLLEDLAAAERRRQLLDPSQSFAAFQDAHDDLFVHAALWLRGGLAGAFLRRYCHHTAALCYFHAKAAMLKRAQVNDTGLVKADRVPAIEGFFAVVVRVASTPTEARNLFKQYRDEWETRAGVTWFDYLRDNWLSDTWCSLFLLSKRDRCARLFLLTTNSVELLWKNFKGSWLRGDRVSDFAFALLMLVGAPGNALATKACVFGKAWFNAANRLAGEQRRSKKAAPFGLIAATVGFGNAVVAGDVDVAAPADGAAGVYTVSSRAPVPQYASLLAGTPTSAATRPAEYPAAPFYSSTSATPASSADTAECAARIAATVKQAQAVARQAVARGVGAAAVTRAGRAGDDSEVDAPLTAALMRRAADSCSVAAQYRGLQRHTAYLRIGEGYVHPVARARLARVNEQRLAHGALREGAGRGFVGSPLTSAAAERSLTAISASPSAAAAAAAGRASVVAVDAGDAERTPLSSALEEALRLNKLQYDAVCNAWEAPQRSDFGAGGPPVFAYVYCVAVGVPARELCAGYDADNVRGENVSRMDGGPVPWGLRLTLEAGGAARVWARCGWARRPAAVRHLRRAGVPRRGQHHALHARVGAPHGPARW